MRFSFRKNQLGDGLLKSAFSIFLATILWAGFIPTIMAEAQGNVSKNSLPNRGVPLFVDINQDLALKPNVVLDSYYVNCSFEAEGKQLGFEWHEMIYRLPQGNFSSTEFLVMNGSEDSFTPNALAEPWSANNEGSTSQLYVSSSLGELKGNQKGMALHLHSAKAQVNVVLSPRKEVLYNGTTGLLNLGGCKSYEYAYPNMNVEGSIVIDGKEYKIKNAVAWFDRQWAGGRDMTNEGDPIKLMSGAWLWLGMPLNADMSASISLWDLYVDGGRNAFATILNKNGTQSNVPATISYDTIWTSGNTGYKYPRKVHVSIPEENIDFTLESLITNPDFVHADGKGAPGCQVLCKASGTYQGRSINRTVIVEMIGNLCGE